MRDSSALYAPKEEPLTPASRLHCRGLRKGRKEAILVSLEGLPLTPWLHRLRDVQQAAADAITRHGRENIVLRVVTDL